MPPHDEYVILPTVTQVSHCPSKIGEKGPPQEVKTLTTRIVQKCCINSMELVCKCPDTVYLTTTLEIAFSTGAVHPKTCTVETEAGVREVLAQLGLQIKDYKITPIPPEESFRRAWRELNALRDRILQAAADDELGAANQRFAEHIAEEGGRSTTPT